MKERLRLPPTRSVLLRLRKRRDALVGAADLLERKRRVLAQKTLDLLPSWEDGHRRAHASLGEAYHSFERTRLRSTSEELRQIVAGGTPMVDLRVELETLAGVSTFQVEPLPEPLRPRFGLLGSTAELDRTIRLLRDAVGDLARLAGEEATLRSLARVLAKTNRQVRMLRDHLVPLYENTIREIEDTLDEEERAYLFQIKRIR